jgi:hypothetical protein
MTIHHMLSKSSPAPSGSFVRIAYYSAAATALLVLLLALARYFAVDPPLSPEVQQMLTLPAKVAADQNGAIYALGITAQGDPYAAGLAYTTAHNAAAAARATSGDASLALPQISTVLGSPTLARKLIDESECDLAKQQCLKAYQAKASTIRTIQFEHATLLQRYEQLQTYPLYQFPLNFEADSPITDFIPITQAARVALMEVAVDIAYPSTQATAMARLHSESVYWRKVLLQSENLIEKMIAAKMVILHTRLASEIILLYPQAANQHTALLAQVTAPLSPSELSMQRPLQSEFVFIAKTIFQLKNPIKDDETKSTNLKVIANFVTLIFLKPQATVNLEYENFQRTITAQSLSAKELLAHQGDLAQPNSPYAFRNILNINNIGGFILSSVTAPDYTDYLLRMHDLDARLRLAEVHRQIVLNDIAAPQIPQFLDKLGAQLWDPYTQAPIAWQADSQTLRVQTHSTNLQKHAPAEIRIAP